MACLAIYLSSSSLNGALDPKLIYIMWWSTCFWVLQMSLVKTSFSLVRRQLRLSYQKSTIIFNSYLFRWEKKLLSFPVFQLTEAHFIHPQLALLLLALVSVPWMLLPKPFLLKRQHDVCNFKLFCFLFIIDYSLNYLFIMFSVPSFSEAPWRVLCTPSRYRRVFAIRSKWWFPWPWGVWIQWNLCTSAHTHDRICAWCSFKYSFLSSIMGSQVYMLLTTLK